HDFVIGFPLWIEIRAAFASAHRQTGKRILEYLFEREKFDDAGADSGMKSQTALVRSKGAIHLYAKAAVHLDLAAVVDPRNAELNHPLGFNKALENLSVSILLVTFDDRPDRFQYFSHRLKKLRLVGITLFNNFENLLHQAHKGVISAGYFHRWQIKSIVRNARATCRV